MSTGQQTQLNSHDGNNVLVADKGDDQSILDKAVERLITHRY